MTESRDIDVCSEEGHIPGCAGAAGGEHELLPDWVSCGYCDDAVDLDGEDVAYSWALMDNVHRDCLIDSGEVA